MTITRMTRLPYGVGHFTGGWYVLIAVLLTMIGLGAYAYSYQFREGLVVTGLRDIGTMGGAPWGLYITFDVYFVGISFAGITTAALIRLLNLDYMKPVSRMAELLTIIALLLAGFSIVPDLGQPLRGIVNLFLYARPQSPFFGTFTLVIAGYLFASLVYFFLDGRRDAAICARVPSPLQGFYRLWASGYHDTPAEQARHAYTSFWLAIAIVPLLVTAHSTLGFVFGLQAGRPGWFSALQAPGFVVMAGISGVGLLVVIAAVVRRLLGEEERLNLIVFRWLANFLMALIVVYLYFQVVEWLTTTYIGHEHEVKTTMALITGEYAWLYWLSIACLVIPFFLLFGQFLLRRHSLPLIVLSGILVNVAALGKRVLIVIPSQTHGALLPYPVGSYSPTWVEYSIILALLSLGTTLYALFMKVFPIMEVPESLIADYAALRRPSLVGIPLEEPVPLRVHTRRRVVTALSLVVLGFALQAMAYFVLGAPWGFPPRSPVYSNPRAILPSTFVAATEQIGISWLVRAAFSPPGVFILGVILVFLGAVVYELMPEREDATGGRLHPEN
jgi:molybdopterin-containing oxidoreductase family membrane subunit